MSTPFSVMTWNVENLFPPGAAISETQTMRGADYHAKLAYLAGCIQDVNPDVVALQEVGGAPAGSLPIPLIDLQGYLGNRYPHAVSSQHPDGRGIRVAFLSRLPVLSQVDIVQFMPGELSSAPDWSPRPPITRMGRGALQIEVEPVPGQRIYILTVHLKSKLVQYPGVANQSRFTPKDEDERTRGFALALLRRTVEAAAVRAHLNALTAAQADCAAIVLGDLNDEPRAASTQMLLGPEDADVTSDDKLDPFRLYNLVDAIPRRGGAENDLYFLPPDQRYSRVYKGHNELIDHILVTKSLLGKGADLRQNRWLVQQVAILVDSITEQSVGDFPAERIGIAHPDHAPVLARFALDEG